MKMSDHQIHQVVVVGAGLTGVMTALALSYCGYGSAEAPAITLIDRAIHNDARAKKTNHDYRTTTINVAGMAMLDALGVWPLIMKKATPISCIKVAYGSPNFGKFNRRQHNNFSLDWHSGETPMAYVVCNQTLLDALYERLAIRPIIQIHGHEITGFVQEGDYARLQFDGRPDLLCHLVVACDGANSKLREQASIRTISEKHRQTAIIANLTSQRNHQHTAFQRFLPNGPIALMPHGDNRVSLVWSLPKSEALRISAVDKETFANLALAAFGDTLGELQLDGPRLNWPLKPTVTLKMTSQNLILAGDASHAIHPLAGQGYNLALSDAAVLADCLANANRRGLNPDHKSIRSEYNAGRWLEVAAMTTMTSGLNQLMSFQPSFARIVGSGMRVINHTPIKSFFQKSAMGASLARANLLEGRLPE